MVLKAETRGACPQTFQLAFWCIDWAKHRQRKAAVKVHMVANVANRLPHFCVFGKAKDHDSKKEDELFSSLKEGDIGIADRAYNRFKVLKQTLQLQDFYGENENAVEECARTEGVGSGERSELRSSLKAPRR